MELDAQFQLLEQAKGDRALLALATISISHADRSPAEIAALQEALVRAAIPHWFDRQLLDVTSGMAIEQPTWELLTALPLIETFPKHGDQARNVHEASRLALRRHLAVARPEDFRQTSAALAAHFATVPTPTGELEHLYHLLSADPLAGHVTLENLAGQWADIAGHEERTSLSAMLRELLHTEMLTGTSQVRARLIVAEHEFALTGGADLQDAVEELLSDAKALGDARLISSCTSLVGDVAESRGRIDIARQCFAEAVAILRAVVASEPTNLLAKQELIAVLSRVGALQAPVDSSATADEIVELTLQITHDDPLSTLNRKYLAVGYGWQAAAALGRGDALVSAQLQQRSKEIYLGLLSEEPGNTVWSSGLSGTLSALAETELNAGAYDSAGQLASEALAVCQALAERDPTNVDWQIALAGTCNLVGRIFFQQDELGHALLAFEQAASINEHLCENDPTSPFRRRDLAVSLECLAAHAEEMGNQREALRLYGVAATHLSQLAEADPTNVNWRADLDYAVAAVQRLRS